MDSAFTFDSICSIANNAVFLSWEFFLFDSSYKGSIAFSSPIFPRDLIALILTKTF